MKKVIENLILNTKKAYKECIALDNTNLEDMLLDVLTDAKKLEEMINNNFEDVIKDITTSKKKRYTYEQVIAITKIQLQLAKEKISLEEASSKILEIADHFPIHNLVQYNKRFKKALIGVGEYGFAFPSNWAKALLEITNNDAMVIKALKEQQRLYREKDGRVNQTLEDLLNGLEKNNIELDFRAYVQETVKNKSTVDGYVKSLIEDFPLKLNIDNIFNSVDIDFLEKLYKRCSVDGDLYEWSYAIGNGRPMSAIKKYIDFLTKSK